MPAIDYGFRIVWKAFILFLLWSQEQEQLHETSEPPAKDDMSPIVEFLSISAIKPSDGKV